MTSHHNRLRERLQKLEMDNLDLNSEQKRAIHQKLKEEYDMLCDSEISNKWEHLTNIEASEKLLARLRLYHPHGPGLPVPKERG